MLYILIISIFNFLIFMHFTNQITLKPSVAQNLKLIFNFSNTCSRYTFHFEPTRGINDEERMKNFYKVLHHCFKIWDEFNANFALLYFSSYSSIKMWHLYLTNVGKNNRAVHLRLVLTYLFLNLFNTKKHLAWTFKKNCSFTFLCIPN